MRATVTIDDALYDQALALAAPGTGKAALVREALQTFVRIQAARRLVALGAGEPRMQKTRRRRSPAPP